MIAPEADHCKAICWFWQFLQFLRGEPYDFILI
jgi:hypothetical protein